MMEPAFIITQSRVLVELVKENGAFPNGMEFDMNYGRTGERPQTDKNIQQVPLPATDPVYGNGPLQDYWK